MMQSLKVKVALNAVLGSTLIFFILNYLFIQWGNCYIFSWECLDIHFTWACIIDISAYIFALLDDSYFYLGCDIQAL